MTVDNNSANYLASPYLDRSSVSPIGPLVGPEGYSTQGPVDQTRLQKRVCKALAKDALNSGKLALINGSPEQAKIHFAKATTCARQARTLGSAKQAIALEKLATAYLADPRLNIDEITNQFSKQRMHVDN